VDDEQVLTVPPRRAVLVAFPVALAAMPVLRGEAGAADAALCIKAARTDRATCMQDAVERCNKNFETSLTTCFGPGNTTCVKGCIASNERCLQTPQAKQKDCRLACSADEKAARERCTAADVETCRKNAAQKALICKQQCTGTALPSKQRCGEALNDCLNGCSG
jgi:hypothetical protein